MLKFKQNLYIAHSSWIIILFENEWLKCLSFPQLFLHFVDLPKASSLHHFENLFPLLSSLSALLGFRQWIVYIHATHWLVILEINFIIQSYLWAYYLFGFILKFFLQCSGRKFHPRHPPPPQKHIPRHQCHSPRRTVFAVETSMNCLDHHHRFVHMIVLQLFWQKTLFD